MYAHQHFDLFLHTDEELNEILGEQINLRETLHEWPLACVQRLTLSTGLTCIYKSQAGPTVEPEFYAQASSTLLPRARSVYRDERYACLIIEDVIGGPLENMSITEPAALSLGRDVLQQIAVIEGEPPVYLDVSTWARWQALMSGMLDDLSGLVASKRFEITRPDDLDALARAAQSPLVSEAYQIAAGAGQLGLVHHDLKADNILFYQKGNSPFSMPEQNFQTRPLRVIDWQRPQRGLVELDLAHLLASLGFDPRPHLHPGVITAADLLRVHWFTECALTWFPPGIKTYDQAVARIARGV